MHHQVDHGDQDHRLAAGGQPAEARYITGAVAAMMWLVFVASFFDLISPGRLRALGAPVSWWALLALIVVIQLSLLHLAVTMLWRGSFLGGGIAVLFLTAVFHFTLDFIQARREAAQKTERADEEK